MSSTRGLLFRQLVSAVLGAVIEAVIRSVKLVLHGVMQVKTRKVAATRCNVFARTPLHGEDCNCNTALGGCRSVMYVTAGVEGIMLSMLPERLFLAVL